MATINADNLPQEDAPTADARPLMVNDLAGATALVLGPVQEDKYLQLAGGTLTGPLTASLPITVAGTGTNPGLAIRNTGGTAGLQRIDLIVTASGVVRLRHRADDGTSNVANIVNIDLSDDSVDITGATSVTVPDATADGQALAHSQNNAVLGTTTVGTLTATGQINVFENAFDPRIVIRDSGETDRSFRLYSANGTMRIQRINDDYSGAVSSILLDLETGALDLSNSPSVGVPAPTAVSHAVQVAEWDAVTGRYAVQGPSGLREQGDTGWHTIASWTGGVQDVSDQWGVIDLANYSLGGTGTLQVRRTGDMVSVRLPNGGSQSITAVTGGARDVFTSGNWPAGFHIETPYGTSPLNYSGYVNDNAPASVGRGSSSNSMKFNAAAGTALTRATATFLGASGWPAVMPGVPA